MPVVLEHSYHFHFLNEDDLDDIYVINYMISILLHPVEATHLVLEVNYAESMKEWI